MADIKDSVDGPGSQVQDIAMIQMMLKVVKDAKGAPYLKVNYSGEWNAETKDAIARFQQDQKLIPPEQPLKGAPDAKLPVTPDAKVTVSPAAAKLPAAAPAALKATEKAGVVELKSATFQKLNAMLPPEYKDALILPGSKTVYFPGTDAAAKAAATHISAHPQLDRVFASKAASFINEFYRQTKIVLKASATGLRRDFAGQMTVTSHAGPGESNHQFGKAADIGFGGLKWVDGDGKINTDTSWLNVGEDTAAKKAYMTPAKAQEFFKSHHATAYGNIGLFKTDLPGDDTHVQAYPDSAVSYSKSLAALLNLSNNMKWQPGTHGKYQADLALGGKAINVGTAKQIYSGKATIEKSDVVAALAAAKQDLSKLNVFKDFEFVKKAIKDAKLPPGKTLPVSGAKVTLKDVTEADLFLLRKAAKADFEKADANWQKWQPIK